MTEIKALVHDVFGTVVDWRSAVAADGGALGAGNGITGIDWQQFADEWRGAYAPSMNRVRTGELPWTNLDALHRLGLDALLKKFEITGLSEEDKVWFNLTWHRLKPCPIRCRASLGSRQNTSSPLCRTAPCGCSPTWPST